MSKSFKADSQTLQQIIEHYKTIQEETSNTNLIFYGKDIDFQVLVYKTSTVLFQGKKAQEELNKWYQEESFIDEHVGSDEVGLGDYFGPIVVCSALVTKSDYDFLESLNVKDSKQLNDESIKKIAPLILEKIKTVTFTLSNKKYNELHDKGYNLNKIKAYCHNFVLNKIVKDNKYNGLVVIDQFCEEKLYYNYLKDYKTEVLENIYFTTKAENKYLAVACASIVARYTFLNEIENISKEIGKKIILGASSSVDDLAISIVKEKGFEYLSNFVKTHYKNTQKILENTTSNIFDFQEKED